MGDLCHIIKLIPLFSLSSSKNRGIFTCTELCTVVFSATGYRYRVGPFLLQVCQFREVYAGTLFGWFDCSKDSIWAQYEQAKTVSRTFSFSRRHLMLKFKNRVPAINCIKCCSCEEFRFKYSVQPMLRSRYFALNRMRTEMVKIMKPKILKTNLLFVKGQIFRGLFLHCTVYCRTVLSVL